MLVWFGFLGLRFIPFLFQFRFRSVSSSRSLSFYFPFRFLSVRLLLFRYCSVLCGFRIRFRSFRFRLFRFHSFYVSNPFYILSITFLFRLVSVPFRYFPSPFRSIRFAFSFGFLIQFHFVFLSDFVGRSFRLFSFRTPFLLFYIRFDLVPISGSFPFYLSFTFRYVRLFLFLFLFGSVSARFDYASVPVPFCFGFGFLLFPLRSFSVPFRFRSVLSPIRSVPFHSVPSPILFIPIRIPLRYSVPFRGPFRFGWVFGSFSFRTNFFLFFISVSISFSFMLVPVLLRLFGSVLFGSFPSQVIFRRLPVSIPFLFRFHSFSVSDPFYLISVPFLFRSGSAAPIRHASVPFRLRSVTSQFRYVSVPFQTISIPVPFLYSVQFLAPLRVRWVFGVRFGLRFFFLISTSISFHFRLFSCHFPLRFLSVLSFGSISSQFSFRCFGFGSDRFDCASVPVLFPFVSGSPVFYLFCSVPLSLIRSAPFPFRPVSVPSRLFYVAFPFRYVPYPFRSILFPFHFSLLPFCVQFRFLFVFVLIPFLFFYFRVDLVSFSGWIPLLSYFSFRFPSVHFFLFLFRLSSISAHFDSVFVLVPFCCGFRFLLFRVRCFCVPVRLRPVPSRLRSVPFRFHFPSDSFLTQFHFVFRFRVCSFGLILGTPFLFLFPFRFRSFSGSCFIFFLSVPFAHFFLFCQCSVFDRFWIRFPSFRFRLFLFNSFPVSDSIFFPFLFCSVQSAFRSVYVLFRPVPLLPVSVLFRLCPSRLRCVPSPFLTVSVPLCPVSFPFHSVSISFPFSYFLFAMRSYFGGCAFGFHIGLGSSSLFRLRFSSYYSWILFSRNFFHFFFFCFNFVTGTFPLVF